MFVYSPPCQAFSVAGKQKGLKDPRGKLFYDALPIIQTKKPKYALMENVKGLTNKGFNDLFEDMLNELNLAGYNNYWKVLNAKDYGIPQNRERVFVISIRKDIDDGSFKFPEPFDCGLRLKDLLENEVDEKYYINNDRVEKLLVELRENEVRVCAERGRYNEQGSIEQQLEIRKDNNINTLTTVQKDNLVIEPNELKFVGGIGNKDWAGDGKEFSRNYPQGNRIYDANGIACSQTAQGGGVGSFTGLYLEQQSPNELRLFTNLSGGKWDKIHESSRRVYEENGIAPTIPTCQGGNIEPKVYTNYKIRKLTPRECWRLMGFSDEDFDKAKQTLMDTYYNGKDRASTQLYKQAGNSVVVNVLEEIYKILFKEWLEY